MMVYGLRLFVIGAIVLIVLGIVASATDSMQALGVWWYTWFMASFLSFLVDLALGSYVVGAAGVTRRNAP
jgi:hypothetical protein